MKQSNKKFDHCRDELKHFYQEIYCKYRTELEIVDFSSCNILEFEKVANLIDEYFYKIDEFARLYKISSQSKFRSSFLEEINIYLFDDLVRKNHSELDIYNKGIYAGLKILNNFKVDIIDKDVDFCIGKKVTVEINDKNKIDIIIPIVAIEVKTYLDATMFGEVQYSARQLKNATPNVKTYVIMEDNQVGKEKIMAARNDNTIDEMFVFKGKNNRKFSSEILLDYYNEVKKSIKNITQEYKIEIPGRLLNKNL